MLVTPPPAGSLQAAPPVLSEFARGGLRDGVRWAAPDDAAAIARVKAFSSQVAFEQRIVPHAPAQASFPGEVRRWAARIAAGPLPVLVAMRGGELVGYVALGEPRGVVDASGVRLAVVQSAHALPVHWTGRVPENLALAAHDLLSQRQYDALHVTVLTENSAAQWFLVQTGFRLVGSAMQRGHLHTRYVKQL